MVATQLLVLAATSWPPERVISILVGVSVIMTFLHVAVLRPILKLVRKVDEKLDSIEVNAAAIDEIRVTTTKAIVDIQQELKPNGGTSLKDQVSRIEDGLNQVKRRQDAHLDYHLNRRNIPKQR